MAKKAEIGYVYIATNPCFEEIKIGSSKNPEKRIKELDKTGTPLPFDIFAKLKTSKYKEVEKLVIKTLDELTDSRLRSNREFFNIKPEIALSILNDIAKTLDDTEIIIPATRTKEMNNKVNKRRSNFKFTMIGISIGEKIIFTPTGQEVKVVSENKVEYENEIYSLSGFTKKYIPIDKRILSNHYDGPKYFTYKGKVLKILRKEREKDIL